MPPRKRFANIIVSEEFKINCEKILETFINNSNVQIYEFPCTLTNAERAWVHNYAKDHYYSLKTKSHGSGASRNLALSKRNLDMTNLSKSQLKVRRDNLLLIHSYVNQLSTYKERNEVFQLKIRLKNRDHSESKLGLGYGVPQQPTLSAHSDYAVARHLLPIWPFRDEILQAIINNQVVIVCGQTGSGKTTQLPQFILDYCAMERKRCRIVCTQPRRISALAVANRVAVERGEHTGQTVGYHIRLESCVSPKTALVYCTNGIVLRTLMGGDSCLESVSHIIVDEIHERDRFSDFLLICLRECLINFPHLRLILMSATIDTATFQNYFIGAPVVHVPGRQHQVTEYFLEDILSMVSYESQAMFNLKKKEARPLRKEEPVVFENLVVTQKEKTVTNHDNTISFMSPNNNMNISVDMRLELEHTIYECETDGSEDAFNQFLTLVLSENAPINYQHSQTGCTALMAAAMHGNLEMCIQLLSYGADLNIYSKIQHYSAIDWAATKQYMDCYYMLMDYQQQMQAGNSGMAAVASASKTNSHEATLHIDSKIALDLYHRTISDQNIDFDLLHILLYHIYLKSEFGSILVFVSGYDDIVTIRDRITADTRFDPRKYYIVTLHSLMQIADQNAVFNPVFGKRKIILATNIAETSITIDDVKYVIDTGKVKEKCYDVLTGICGLQCNWISQAASKQRAGRAGRTQSGECYHMFTFNRYTSIQEYATPEILRMPLHELCLQTKLLAPPDVKIAEFLSRSIEAPSSLAVSNAVKHLQEIDALDNTEALTLLGQHLVDLPVEPRLAKMLIYAVIFKCVDPILTIVAFQSQRDPFMLPPLSHLKAAAMKKRKRFAIGTFSDHMILLRVFQEWQDARLQRSERVFCNENFVSSATMDMVIMIRSQLLAQLRATGFVRTKPPGDIRDLNENANNWPLIKAILTLGLFPNIACINRSSMQIRNKKEKKIFLHNSSSLRQSDPTTHGRSNDHVESLRNIPSNWLIYDEISRFNTSYNIRSVTSVSPITVSTDDDNLVVEIRI